jgi:hypothetical protein
LRRIRLGSQAKLQSSEAHIQELQASLAESERERVRLQAQVETLGQLLSRIGSPEAELRAGGGPDACVLALQKKIQVRITQFHSV